MKFPGGISCCYQALTAWRKPKLAQGMGCAKLQRGTSWGALLGSPWVYGKYRTGPSSGVPGPAPSQAEGLPVWLRVVMEVLQDG